MQSLKMAGFGKRKSEMIQQPFFQWEYKGPNDAHNNAQEANNLQHK